MTFKCNRYNQVSPTKTVIYSPHSSDDVNKILSMNAATITIKRREFHSDFPVSEKFSRNVACQFHSPTYD